MADEILSYVDMCIREGVNFQKGMNFDVGTGHSVFLMSLRRNAPYRDSVEDDGTTLIYEGHDTPRRKGVDDPKIVDQPEFTASGALTENGKFHGAAQGFREGLRPPERVRVYEKLLVGVWAYAGLFHLVDSWKDSTAKRPAPEATEKTVKNRPTLRLRSMKIRAKLGFDVIFWTIRPTICVLLLPVHDWHPFCSGFMERV